MPAPAIPGRPAPGGHTGRVSTASGRLFWLLRHAKTVADPPKGGTDHERRLAPRGRRDADALGVRLGDQGDCLGLPRADLPRLVLCSTATRTRQTAERVLAKMEDPPTVGFERALYHADEDEVIEQVRLVDDDVRSVMVVGHNPTAQAMALSMLERGDKSGLRRAERAGFPTCALAVYRLDLRHWADLTLEAGSLAGLFVPPY
jgi:phosphohistidine phosphatase